MKLFLSVDNSQDTIDSRDIIERYDDLLNELTDVFDSQVENDTENSFDEWLKAQVSESNPEADEFISLRNLVEQCEGYGDWEHGETLIRHDYFTEHIKELIEDCYKMPKELDSGKWPWRHVSIDYEAAADEAKDDYMTVDFDGVEYLMRT